MGPHPLRLFFRKVARVGLGDVFRATVEPLILALTRAVQLHPHPADVPRRAIGQRLIEVREDAVQSLRRVGQRAIVAQRRGQSVHCARAVVTPRHIVEAIVRRVQMGNRRRRGTRHQRQCSGLRRPERFVHIIPGRGLGRRRIGTGVIPRLHLYGLRLDALPNR